MNNLPALSGPDLDVEIAGLAHAYGRASGPVLRLINRMGDGIEGQMKRLPVRVQEEIGRVTSAALEAAYGAASVGAFAPDVGRNGVLAAAMVAGAVGGAGGLLGSLAELPVTITVMLHAIRAEAKAAGYDPAQAAVRLACLEVFASGTPLKTDDGVNTAFLSARLTVAGPTFQKVAARAVERLAAVMGQKLAAQAVPVIGAVTGAALNAAYLSYYRELARIRFRLMRLSEIYGAGEVLGAFGKACALPQVIEGR